MGFLRFQEGDDGLLQAWCQPQYCVLPLVASHFHKRLSPAPWRIIDTRRRLVLDGSLTPPQIQHYTAQPESPCPAAPDAMSHLWRTYYHQVTVPERHNPRRQAALLPERFQVYLPEG